MVLLAELDASGLARAIARVLPGLHEQIKRELATQATAVALRAKLNHDYDDQSGDLTRSIEAEPVKPLGGGYQATISADAGHAKFVEHGTRAHMVKPRRAAALAFRLPSGKMAFSKGHRVKGIQPRKFLESAAFDQLEPMRDGFEDAALRAFAAAGFEVTL